MSSSGLKDLSKDELIGLVEQLLSEVSALRERVSALEAENTVLRDENARLKGLKGRPKLKPSGMEEATNRPKGKRKKGKRASRRSPRINEERKLTLDAPPRSRFKGYDDFVVQDLRLEGRVIRYRRERWLTPDGGLLVAPLPVGLRGHFGPELIRFVRLQHHQGQVTTDRIVQLLNSVGLVISKRRVLRLLSDDVVPVCRSYASKIRHGKPDLRPVGLQAGMPFATKPMLYCAPGLKALTGSRSMTRAQGIAIATASPPRSGPYRIFWALHLLQDHVLEEPKEFPGAASSWPPGLCHLPVCSRIAAKIRHAKPDLRPSRPAGGENAEALAYRRERHLTGAVIEQLDGHAQKAFDDEADWSSHLDRLGISQIEVHPDPVKIATEGALWGSIQAHVPRHQTKDLRRNPVRARTRRP